MRRRIWAFPITWMAVILWLGSDTASADSTGRLLLPLLRWLFPGASPVQLDAMHGAVRKLGHVTEYAVLAGLWSAALVNGRTMARPGAARLAWLIAIAWAVVDESLQSAGRSRTASAWDVALDATGALLVAWPVARGWRRVAEVTTGIALWTAAVGGAILLSVNRLSDVGSGVLWVTVPTAVALLALRRATTRRSTARLPSPRDR